MNMSHSIMKIYCDYFREYRKTFVWVHTCCLLWMWEPVSGFYLFYFGEPTEINESLRMQSEIHRSYARKLEITRNYATA